MNIDNVMVSGPTAEAELVSVLTAAFPPSEVDTSTPGGTRLVLDSSTALDVQYDTDDEWPGMVSVYSSAGEAALRATAQRVFDKLAERTSWSLELISDSAGDDVIASRPALAHPA